MINCNKLLSVIMENTNGVQRALDADTGKVLYEQMLGNPATVLPTFGADSDGKMKVFRVIGSSGAPSGIVAYGLPDKVPEPQVVTKELIKEVPKEVIKEVPKEVTKTVTVETISPISYAAIGIGVVMIVIGGVLFSRRKKV
ncbi:MAG: LPXTG cell wall anchor domain-containing protein [Thaumarchaeota archaeon]|nr:LPXTG cell wall anchor domain-containing protein [Nitrososphaerota archaeon]